MADFKYTPLEEGSTIRVLVLQPATDASSPLQASLEPCALPTDAAFEALSYVWGEDGPTEDLDLSHATFKITKNLHAALVQLRQPIAERRLWVDAVCINQQDDAEKSRQVARMGDIFKSASKVLVWLGPSSATSQQAMGFLQTLSGKAESLGVNKVDVCIYMQSPSVKCTKEEAKELVSDAVSNAVPGLLGRPWFRRLWIVQEYTLGKIIEVWCGSDSMGGIDFATAVTTLIAAMYSVGGAPPEFARFIDQVWTIIRHRAQTRLMSSPGAFFAESRGYFELALRDFRDQGCKNDKDRVYALLALEPEPLRIRPDYTQTVAEVYTEFSARTIGYTTFFLAGLARRGAIPECLSSAFDRNYLPSWVPDLRKWRERWSPIFSNYFVMSAADYGRLGWIRDPVLPRIAISHGFEFDTVKRILTIGGDGFRPQTSPESCLALFAFLSRIHRRFDAGPWHITARDYPTAWATMIAGGRTHSDTELSNHPLSELLTQSPRIPVDVLVKHMWNTYRTYCLNPEGSLHTRIATCTTDTLPADFTTTLSPSEALAWRLHQHLCVVVAKHDFFLTERGYIGLAPPDCLAGDAVGVLSGHRTPFMLRRVPGVVREADACCRLSHLRPDGGGTTPFYALLGPCYLAGIMHGELYRTREYAERFRWLMSRMMPDGVMGDFLPPLPMDVIHLI